MLRSRLNPWGPYLLLRLLTAAISGEVVQNLQVAVGVNVVTVDFENTLSGLETSRRSTGA